MVTYEASGLLLSEKLQSNGKITNNMQLRVVLEASDEGGYTVLVPSLPGCISEGDTREEALRNIKETIALYLEPVEDDANFSENAEFLEVAV
jgi:predicted RNase H-like HicB family nuclease